MCPPFRSTGTRVIDKAVYVLEIKRGSSGRAAQPVQAAARISLLKYINVQTIDACCTADTLTKCPKPIPAAQCTCQAHHMLCIDFWLKQLGSVLGRLH